MLSLSYEEITSVLTRFSYDDTEQAFAANRPALTRLLTHLRNLRNARYQSSTNPQDNIPDAELSQLRTLLLACYCEKVFHVYAQSIQTMVLNFKRFFIRKKKLLDANSIRFAGFHLDHATLTLLFKQPTKDFGRKFTIKDFSGATVTDLKAAQLLIDKFDSLENIKLPVLVISDIEDCKILDYSRGNFIIGTVEVLIALLKVRDKFSNLGFQQQFSLAGHSLAGITCRSVNKVHYLLSLDGNLEGVVLPASLEKLDLTNLRINKNNLQYLINQGIPLNNLHPKNLANLQGIQFRSFIQIQAALNYQIELSQITLTDLKITDSAQIDTLIKAGIKLEGIVLQSSVAIPLHLHAALPFETLTPGHYQALMTMTKVRKNKNISLPPFSAALALAKHKLISDLNDTQIALFGNWLSDVIQQDNLRDDFKRELEINFSCIEPIAKTPIQYELLESLLDQYQKQCKFYTITPSWIRSLRKLLTKSTKDERLTAAQHGTVYDLLTEDRRKMSADKKFRDFETEPHSLENKLLFILAWLLVRAGYDMQDLLPPVFSNIGALGLDLKDIDFNDLYIMQLDRGIEVYRISELREYLKSSHRLANPSNDREFSDNQIRELLLLREDLQTEMLELHHANREIVSPFEHYVEIYESPETNKLMTQLSLRPQFTLSEFTQYQQTDESPVLNKLMAQLSLRPRPTLSKFAQDHQQTDDAPEINKLEAQLKQRPQFTLTEFTRAYTQTYASEVVARARMSRYSQTMIGSMSSQHAESAAAAEEVPSAKSSTSATKAARSAKDVARTKSAASSTSGSASTKGAETTKSGATSATSTKSSATSAKSSTASAKGAETTKSGATSATSARSNAARTKNKAASATGIASSASSKATTSTLRSSSSSDSSSLADGPSDASESSSASDPAAIDSSSMNGVALNRLASGPGRR